MTAPTNTDGLTPSAQGALRVLISLFRKGFAGRVEMDLREGGVLRFRKLDTISGDRLARENLTTE